MTDTLVAGPEERSGPPPRMRAVVSLLVAAALLLGAVVAVKAYRNRPPSIEPGDLKLSWTAQVVASTGAAQVLAENGAPSQLQIGTEPERPVLVGRLTYTPLPAADGQVLFLVVSGPNGVLSESILGAGPTEGASRGWDGRYSQLADDYSWLSGARDITLPDGSSTSTGQALYLPEAGPLDVVAELPEGVVEESAVTVTVVLQRDDDLVWAQRV